MCKINKSFSHSLAEVKLKHRSDFIKYSSTWVYLSPGVYRIGRISFQVLGFLRMKSGWDEYRGGFELWGSSAPIFVNNVWIITLLLHLVQWACIHIYWWEDQATRLKDMKLINLNLSENSKYTEDESHVEDFESKTWKLTSTIKNSGSAITFITISLISSPM